MPFSPITFETNDKLGLSGFAGDLEAFIMTEQHFVAGSLVISLNAPFGAGKSTFLHMWKSSLEKRRKTDQTLPIPIILNSWESDHCGDPLLAIISSVSNELRAHGFAKDKVNNIRDAAKDVAWFGIGLANSFISEATGIDAIAASELAEKKKSERQNSTQIRPDLLASFERRTKALAELKDALDDIFQPAKLCALIMVDELDRCRPDYAVEFLEAIKHVFTAKGVTFVLAVDKSQLCASAQALFGQNLRFDEYYRKFAHRNISLPLVNSSSAPILIKHYWDLIVAHTEHRPATRTFAIYDQGSASNLQEVAVCLKLNPRQIHEMLRIIGHVMAMKSEKKGDLFWGFRLAAILMAGLSIGAPEVYEFIGNKRATFQLVRNSLNDLFSHKEHGEWWIIASLSGAAFKIDSYDGILQEAKGVGLLTRFENGANLKARVDEFSNSAWSHSSHEQPFAYVYSIVEKLRRFENPA